LNGSPVTFPAIGTWTIIPGTGVFLDANDPNTVVGSLSVGETIIRWTVDNGPCESGISDDDMSIFLFDENQPVANAGPDQELCTPNTSTTMAGSAFTFPGTGTWSLISGAGDIADANDPNTTITNLAVGENIFQWVVTNGPCANPLTTDLVSIFVFDQNNPDANAGADQQICTPVTTATLAGSPLTFPATGAWTIVSGTGTITDPADPNTTVTDIGIGTIILEWTVSNGPCANAVTNDQVQIELFDLNSPPAAAGPDQEFCTPNTTAIMAGNAPTPPGSGLWTVAQGAADFADATDPTTAASNLPVGENILVWTLTQGVCGVSHDSVSVFIFDENNPPANAGPDVEICTPQDSIFLSGNTPTFPAQGTWTLIEGAGLFEDVNDPTSKVVGLTIGTNTFVWTVDNGPCPNAITADTMTVILYSDSTNAPNAGPDQEACLPQTIVQMAGETPLLPATGTWSIISGSGTVVEVSNPTTLVTDLGIGITTMVWTLDLGPCPNNGLLTDTVLITVFDPTAPPADAGPDQELCTPDDSTAMQALVPTFPGYGTWTLISGTGIIADTLDPATSITGLTIGLNSFDWMVYNGTCGFGPPTHDTITIAVFDSSAAPAAAGPDQEFCTPNTTASMSANSAVFPGTGNWSIASGGGTFADAADPLTTVSDLPVGDNLLVWTIDNGACGTTTDTLLIRIYDSTQAAADAGPDQEICVPTQPNTVTMAANAPIFPATGLWTLVSGTATITDPTDPGTGITDLEPGITVLSWNIDNGPCGPPTIDLVQISVFDAGSPSANAGADQQLCAPVGAVALTGNAPISPATGVWTVVSGTGNVTDASSPTSGITGLAAGANVLVWTLDNGACGTTSDTVTIQVFDGSIGNANAGSDQNFCSLTSVDASMDASLPTFPATGLWLLLSGSGTITDATNPATSITDIGFGTNEFQWTVSNGPCGVSTDALTISVFDGSELPANAGPDQVFCLDTTKTAMHAVPLVSETATGLWSLLEGAADILFPSDTATEVENIGTGLNIFLWTVENGVCPTTSDTMLITINDCADFTIPDAFSPNGDGVNDLYVIEGLEAYRNNSFQVYNRWGTQVLELAP
jgi:hypothetical protein